MLKLDGISIAGICSAVPKQVLKLEDIAGFTQEEANKLADAMGFVSFRVADENMTTSDYCAIAAKRLMEHLGISSESIDAVIFISQTADYILPSTSVTLQARLKLREDILTFDINQGCPGFIYGIFQGSALIRSGVHRVLLCIGETSSKLVNPMDRPAKAFFGDGAAAVILER